MPQCSAPGCTQQGGHKFPTDKVALRAWVIGIRRADAHKRGDLWQPGPAARVCHRHFTESDYKPTNFYGKDTYSLGIIIMSMAIILKNTLIIYYLISFGYNYC